MVNAVYFSCDIDKDQYHLMTKFFHTYEYDDTCSIVRLCASIAFGPDSPIYVIDVDNFDGKKFLNDGQCSSYFIDDMDITLRIWI